MIILLDMKLLDLSRLLNISYIGLTEVLTQLVKMLKLLSANLSSAVITTMIESIQ